LETAGVQKQEGIIAIMLTEHEASRKLVAKLKDAVAWYGTGEEAGSSNVSEISNQYIELLTQHITKENRILFPMADSRLPPDKDSALFDAFE
jgi:hemerythrin-like domain-containing protein